MTIPRASRVAFAVAFVAASGPVAGIGVTGAAAQEVPELHTAATPLFHSSASSDDRVSRIGWVERAMLLSPHRFVFLDHSDARLVFVDTTDEHVISAGREGDGPLEFRIPVLTGRPVDGELVVWDRSRARVTLVSTDGVIREAPGYDRSAFAGLATRVAGSFADGALVITADAWPISAPQPGPYRDTVRFQVLVPDQTAGLLAEYLGPESYYEVQGSRSATRWIVYAHQLYDTQVGNHLAVAQTDLGVVHVLDLSGATVAEIPLPPAVRMSRDQIAAERKRIEEEAKERAEERDPMFPMMRPLVFDLPANNVAPAINHMLGDLDGRLWLRIFRPDEEAEHWQVWDLEGPNLEFTLTLPEGEELLDAAGNRVLVLTRDEFDVQYLVLREIEG